MSAEIEQRWISPEEYLAEEPSPEADGSAPRREYVNGHVFPLTPGDAAHDRIVVRLAQTLTPAACGGACNVYSAGVRLRVQTANAFYYPDLILTCERTDESGVVYAPGLVAEVVGPDTAQIDRREKLSAYLTIPWLKEYLIVDQSARRVDLWRRTPDGWRCERREEGAFNLECAELTMTVEQIYE